MYQLLRILFASLVVVSGCARLPLASNYDWRLKLSVPVECVEILANSNGRTILAGSSIKKCLFRSDDYGITWDTVLLPLPPKLSITVRQILSHPQKPNLLFIVCGNAGILRSDDTGEHWSAVLKQGDVLGEALSIAPLTGFLYYGEYWRGPTWKSTNDGVTWSKVGEASKFVGLCTTVASSETPTYLLAGSNGGAIAKSTNEGKTWRIVLKDEYDSSAHLGPEVPKILADPDNAKHYWASRWLAKSSSLVETFDDGETWQSAKSPSKKIWYLDIDRFAPSTSPRRIWAGLFNVHRTEEAKSILNVSLDNCRTWSNCNFPETYQIWMIKYSISGQLFVATDVGLFVSKT